MKKYTSIITRSSLMLASLWLMPGCDLFKKSEQPSPTPTAPVASTPAEEEKSGISLCSINGKPVINEDDFNKSIAQVLQANPFWRGAGGADALPLAIKRKFLDEMIKQELIVAYQKEQNLENDAAFQNELKDMLNLVKRSLLVQFFEKKIFDDLQVTDKDIQKHYNENKDRYVKVAGGVLVATVAFDTEAAADEFKAKSPTNLQDFEKAAKEAVGGKFNDYGRVSKESRNEMGIDIAPKALKAAVLDLKSYPVVDKVKVGKQFHIFCATDPKETEFFALEEIRPQIEGILKNNLFRDSLDEKLKSLSKSFKVDINEDFFKEKESEKNQSPSEANAFDEGSEENLDAITPG